MNLYVRKSFWYYSLFLKSLNTCHCLYSEPVHSLLLLPKTASVTWLLMSSHIRFILPECCCQYVTQRSGVGPCTLLMSAAFVALHKFRYLLSYKNNRDGWKNGRVWRFDSCVECHTNVRWKKWVITVNETSDSTLAQSVLYKVFCTKAYFFSIQINHQPDATIFQFIILTFIYSSTCFGRFLAHHQELNYCSGCLWFYLRIVVRVVLCSWSGWLTVPNTNTARLSPRYEGKARGCHCSHWAPDDWREKARNMLSCK